MPTRFPFAALPGPFNFLWADEEELAALFPDLERTLPRPQAVFLEDEEATPLTGFAVLVTPDLERLVWALEEHLLAEERAQLAICRRLPPDRQAQGATWARYRELLARAVENVTLSSYGRNFPGIFWLHHSQEIARVLKETPRRILREDTEAGRRHGDAIRYRVLERYLDRVLSEVYDVVTGVAADTEEIEEELFPRLLTRLRDNVLLLTEDHVGADLAELGSYFRGYLGVDGRDLRRRLDEVESWHRERLAADPTLGATAQHLMRLPARAAATMPERGLLTRPGYLRFLASRPDYQAARRGDHLLAREQVEVWEGLLLKLKEFELVHALRRTILPTQRVEERLVTHGGAVRAMAGRSHLALSPATRPVDFMAPWVVDPQVARFGMVYDITDFSELVSVLRRSGRGVQDDAFRTMFRLQRRIHRSAAARRLRLEKYLGDGAFYSGRFATQLLAVAVQAQRIYRQALAEGFPFDRGMRIAINFAEYRLIPIASGEPGEDRYEFFGHGIIELTRLTTGKALREIDEVKAMLLSLGYPASAVHGFFAPLQRDPDPGEGLEEGRPFRAYISRHGHLVNEGIVATEAYLRELDRELVGRPLTRASDGERGYVRVELDDPGGTLPVGLRKLGVASLKGIDRAVLFEVVDGADWASGGVPVVAGSLCEALDRELAGTLLEAAG